jgi:D-alanyl-D-alanine carboxypeptidase/D-alanyl-D-alanine-endopeptidase (penicillin-binding protein 4)
LSAGKPAFTYDQGPGHEDWTVASAALGKGGSRWLPVRQPGPTRPRCSARWPARRGSTCRRASWAGLPAGTEIARADSEALTEVLRDMLKFSTNITAECCGLASSGAASLAASGRAMTDWARGRLGIGSEFFDHSGLGARSRITAADMVKALLVAHREGLGLKPILRDVGMKDDKGA